MLRLVLAAALTLLAACGERGEPAGEVAPEIAMEGAASTAPQAPGATAPAPAAEAGPGVYVGRWAAAPNLCASGAWVFTAESLQTAGEVSCRFRRIDRTSAGWEVDASCTAEGPAQDAELTLTLTDPAPPETMTVAGGPLQSVTLRRCP